MGISFLLASPTLPWILCSDSQIFGRSTIYANALNVNICPKDLSFCETVPLLSYVKLFASIENNKEALDALDYTNEALALGIICALTAAYF